MNDLNTRDLEMLCPPFPKKKKNEKEKVNRCSCGGKIHEYTSRAAGWSGGKFTRRQCRTCFAVYTGK